MTEPVALADHVSDVVSRVITPLLALKRTMVMPFDRQRQENVGEHSFSLAMLAGALAETLDPQLDIGLVVQYATVHDIVEAYAGDVAVWEPEAVLAAKAEAELRAAG